MDAHSRHIQQWKHNRSLIGIIPRDYPDWIATVSFYTALQAVDALLRFDKVPTVTSHEARNRVLANTNKYLAIAKAYFRLYDMSLTVRYLADPTKWIPVDKIETIVFPHVYEIEKSVQRLMKQDFGLPRLSIGGTS